MGNKRSFLPYVAIIGFFVFFLVLLDWRVIFIVIAAVALAAVITVLVVKRRKSSLRSQSRAQGYRQQDYQPQDRRPQPEVTLSTPFAVTPIEAALPKPGTTTADQLLGALRARGYNVNAFVVEGGDQSVTVRHIVTRIANLADGSQVEAEQLVPFMPQVYDKLWDYAETACDKYKDHTSIMHYIAFHVLKDMTSPVG